MNWIILTVIAQFFNALVVLIDKRIVSDEKILPRPFVYAFYTCLIAGIWSVFYVISLLPFDFGISLPSFENVTRPTLEIVSLALLSAYTFFFALVSMFTALREADASDVVPVIGATSAVASFGLSSFFLGTSVRSDFALGIILLALGTFLVSRFHFTIKTAFISIHAGIFFALHYIAMKGLFTITSFDDGFFWSRMALVFFALSLLMVPTYYKKITEQTRQTTSKAGFLIFGNKVLAGISTIFILKATDLGDVAVVQALGGLQFVFVLILGILFSIHTPTIFPCENCKSRIIFQKVLFVSIISLGFLVLFR